MVSVADELPHGPQGCVGRKETDRLTEQEMETYLRRKPQLMLEKKQLAGRWAQAAGEPLPQTPEDYALMERRAQVETELETIDLLMDMLTEEQRFIVEQRCLVPGKPSFHRIAHWYALQQGQADQAVLPMNDYQVRYRFNQAMQALAQYMPQGSGSDDSCVGQRTPVAANGRESAASGAQRRECQHPG